MQLRQHQLLNQHINIQPSIEVIQLESTDDCSFLISYELRYDGWCPILSECTSTCTLAIDPEVGTRSQTEVDFNECHPLQ